jgi:hypothetical protein
MATQFEFSLNITGTDDLDSTPRKPALPIPADTMLKRAMIISAADASGHPDSIRAKIIGEPKAVILTHDAEDRNIEADYSDAIRVLRAIEKEQRSAILIALSMTCKSDRVDDDIMNLCRLAYTSGVDAILVSGGISAEMIQEIRTKALGLRGRRLKILLDNVSEVNEAVKLADGLIASSQMNSDSAREILRRQKLLLTRRMDQTDMLRADMLIYPVDEATTPATTVPSSPVLGAVSPTSGLLRSLLMNELGKFLTSSSRLIIALSEEGASVGEMSSQDRISGNRRLPPIVGLSASESSCRFMGCLYGVIPLQTASFVSIDTVVMNALSFAKERKLIQDGDEVIVVLQPPQVTASTNEMCFEGIVQKRYA